MPLRLPDVPRPSVIAENRGWSVTLSGTPVAADGPTLHQAVSDFTTALREFVQDWEERLHLAPNHRSHWTLVCLLGLMSDDEVKGWTLRGP